MSSTPPYAIETDFTVHFYEPMDFTHQGADWIDPTPDTTATWYGTDAEQKALLAIFTTMTEWNSQESRGYELYIGEFGVYSLYANKYEQKAWTAFVAREAEKRKMSWAYWEYCAGFGAYNDEKQQWRTHLLDALVPEE